MSLSITSMVYSIASAVHQLAPSPLQQEFGRIRTGDAHHDTFIVNLPFRMSYSNFYLCE